MECDWQEYDIGDGMWRAKCSRAGCPWKVAAPSKPSRIYGPPCGAGGDASPAPPGPGDHLRGRIHSLGITKTDGCGCDELVAKMNQGVEWCEAHRDEILEHLRTAYNAASVLTKLRAGANAIAQGLPLTIEGLLDEAISRSRLPEKTPPNNPETVQ